MESLKKIISLKEASKLSGYTQDYLGQLIRKGDIKGRKIGRGWFTTEEEINNYFFKQKIRHKEFAIKGFFSRRRTNNIFYVAVVLFIGFFSILFYKINFSDIKDVEGKTIVNQKLSGDTEIIEKIK